MRIALLSVLSVLCKYVDGVPTVSLSGHSSGGDMAAQHFVAFSKSTTGLAHLQAAPYACGAENATFPVSACTSSGREIDFEFLINYTDSRAYIDPPFNMKGKPVYVFSGRDDRVVPESVVEVSAKFYEHYDANTVKKFDLAAGHAFITLSYGNPCSSTYAPFVNKCGYDMAGAALQHIYGSLHPRAHDFVDANFATIDQAHYGASRHNGMGSTAYAYVPSGCKDKVSTCRLHLVYHGCSSSVTCLGDTIYKHAGYNQWAESNDIVVIYPQAHGCDCWDWKGTYGPLFDTQKGTQLMIVNAMVAGFADSVVMV